MRIKAFTWYVSSPPSLDRYPYSSQISVVADMVALPTFMAESLVKARGSYGHAALNMAKGVVWGTTSSLSSKEKDGKKS